VTHQEKILALIASGKFRSDSHLARVLDVHTTTLWRWKAGKSEPTDEYCLARINVAYDEYVVKQCQSRP